MSQDQTQDAKNELEVRREKLETMQKEGIVVFAERYEKNHEISDIAGLEDGTEEVSIAGRVIAIRDFGKLTFGDISDHTGKSQFAFVKSEIGEEEHNKFSKFIDVGDYIGISGSIFTTKKGEKTVRVKEWEILSKSLRPLPEKFHGLVDTEQRLRKRYLELISSQESMDRFKVRTKVIKTIRNYLDDNKFLEIDTPVLTNKASGAFATPFTTHHNALDIDIYLRIAPETYLKRAIAGGFDRVYEFARCFRNEGMDPSHLPDFTMLEYYASYWNYEDNMDFTEKLIKHTLDEVIGSQTVTYDDKEISFDGEWPRISFRDLIFKDCGIDIDKTTTKEELLKEIKDKNITIEDENLDKVGRGTLIDLLYKKVSRPSIVNPLFVIKHPIDISPLARKNDQNGQIVDRFQLVVNGWEVINAYSELIDPVDQLERFEEQQKARESGDMEAMEIDYDFLGCMEYGMPPMSGWGMGIDRFVALITNAATLRDVVLFPLMRPE